MKLQMENIIDKIIKDGKKCYGIKSDSKYHVYTVDDFDIVIYSVSSHEYIGNTDSGGEITYRINDYFQQFQLGKIDEDAFIRLAAFCLYSHDFRSWLSYKVGDKRHEVLIISPKFNFYFGEKGFSEPVIEVLLETDYLYGHHFKDKYTDSYIMHFFVRINDDWAQYAEFTGEYGDGFYTVNVSSLEKCSDTEVLMLDEIWSVNDSDLIL